MGRHIHHKAFSGDGNMRTGFQITVRACRVKVPPDSRMAGVSCLEVLWAHQWSTGGAGCPPQDPGEAITSGSADQWKGCPTWPKYSQHLLQSVHEEWVHWGPTCCWAAAIFSGSCGCVKMWLFMTLVYFQMFVLTALNIIHPILWTAGGGVPHTDSHLHFTDGICCCFMVWFHYRQISLALNQK